MTAIEQLYNALLTADQPYLASRRAAEAALIVDIRSRWSEPFDKFEILIHLAREVALQAEQALVTSGDAPIDLRTTCLTLLALRAVQIADEIKALLAAGLATGGLARWRALHEVETVALVIEQYGEQHPRLSERYLATYWARMRTRMTGPKQDLLDPIRDGLTDETVRFFDQVGAAMKQEFRAIDKEWEWARPIFTTLPEKTNVDFPKVAAKVRNDEMRMWVDRASTYVHGGSTPLFDPRLGTLTERRQGFVDLRESLAPLLFMETISLSARSLAHSANALQLSKSTTDDVRLRSILRFKWLAERIGDDAAAIARSADEASDPIDENHSEDE